MTKVLNTTMNVTLLTTCTNRKQGPVPDSLSFASMPVGEQSKVCESWAQSVIEAPKTRTAQDTYSGRGFQEAKATSLRLNSDFYIISAGLGLVPSSTLIPAYDATLSKSSTNCIARNISDVFDAGSWWNQLNKLTKWGSSISSIVHDESNDLVLLALTSTYVPLVLGDLETISSKHAEKVRIVGLRSDDLLPERLRSSLMPYDERFDGPDGQCRGTRSDFPQRATRHFAGEFLSDSPRASRSKHAAFVQEYLANMSFPETVRRQKMTDDEIVATIKKHWHDASGNSAKMLRLFRDNLLIACEQKRFSNLFNQVKKQGLDT